MDVWRRLVLLEEIVWKLVRKKRLSEVEMDLVNEVVRIRDYGQKLK